MKESLAPEKESKNPHISCDHRCRGNCHIRHENIDGLLTVENEIMHQQYSENCSIIKLNQIEKNGGIVKKEDTCQSSGNFNAFFLLLCFIFLIYSNTFNSSWHLDDYPNIINNPHLHLSDLRPQSIEKTFFASIDKGLYSGKTMYRPVSCLTFALNWYFGKADVTGYHFINICIHFLTAFLLFITILNLFNTPVLRGKYQGNEYLIALLAAVFWAINPIQTQAVTYIVQRMAMLATMFYILGIWAYIKARTSSYRSKRILLYAGCFLSCILAACSKENAVTLPLALLLIEVCFFQRFHLLWAGLKFSHIAAGAALIIICVGLIFFVRKDPFSVLNGYGNRPFTLSERLLTEPRIIIFYVSLILFPAVNRLSIDHDIVISTSLFEPWTTIPAILIIMLFTGFGFYQIRKHPIVAFGILFFLLNHLIESTIIPLEIIFEHRNYLPSMFIFFPVAAGIIMLVDYYREKKRSNYRALVAFVCFLCIWLGSNTYMRNEAWATEKTLWEDSMVKAPGLARPVHNLAMGHYARTGQYDSALNLYSKALTLKDTNQKKSKAYIYNNMAGVYDRKGQYSKAVNLYKSALEISPDFEIAMYNMSLSLMKDGKWDQASRNTDQLLRKRYHIGDYLNLKGYLLVKQNKFTEAAKYFRDALRVNPGFENAVYNLAGALSLDGHYKQAEWFYRRSDPVNANDILTFAYLIQNSLRAGNKKRAEQYTKEMFARYSTRNIMNIINGGALSENILVPVSMEIMGPLIEKQLLAQYNEVVKSKDNTSKKGRVY